MLAPLGDSETVDGVFPACPAGIVSLFLWGAVHPHSSWRVLYSWRSWWTDEPPHAFLLFYQLLNIAALAVLTYWFLFEAPELGD